MSLELLLQAGSQQIDLEQIGIRWYPAYVSGLLAMFVTSL